MKMKKLLLVAALLTPLAAVADDAYVYPFAGMKVGATVQNEFPTILYTGRKCDLPLANAKNMRRYESYRGVWDIGCWGVTIDDDAVIIVPQMPTKSMPLNVLARADVKRSGDTTTITIKALPTYGR
ncbi:hypothetical protein [Burkholderia multivorans]|uniref:hypothetical protein n=1 Tax=Burkholderia multivorans TaxID=87883 RepID=UPI0021C0EBBF|nr:hypothetical protein [Burkholderia multivorans]